MSTGLRFLWRCRLAWVVILSLAGTSCALAHEGRPHDLWTSWDCEPGIVLGLALTAWLYARGVRSLWQTSAAGRGIQPWEAISFGAGWLALGVALISPIHALGRVLFSAHMTQHEILMLVAAPLLVLGRPIVPFLWALPKTAAVSLARWSKTPVWFHTWRTISNPFVAWTIHAIVLWSWHIPALFQATLESEFVHALQHASFLFSALLFWWAVIHGRRRALGFGLAVLYMFTTALHSGLLGALLTFANSVWYPAYAERTAAWGLTPLEDQQIGGLIMWIPAGLVYVAAALALFAGWLRESEARARS